MALSNAERQRRRYIARLKGKATVSDESVSNEFMRLKAFVRQLERENATLKEKLATVTNEVAGLKASVDKLNLENKSLKGELADAKRREGDLELKLRAPKSTMTPAQFAAIRKCLHPDTICRLHDEGLTKRFEEAFKILTDLRPRLVKA
jgi:chromosome segregation ATPase